MADTSSDQGRLERIVQALGEVGLEAVVVGAMAAVLRGVPLMTADVDLLVRDTPRNREKFEAFARVLGAAKPRLISEVSSALVIEGGPVSIDLLLEWIPGGLKFASVRSRAERVSFGPHTVLVASLADIARSKAASGRPKDAYHLELIRQALAVRGDK